MTERVIAIVLNETDRELVWIAALALMSLDPGPRREAFETMAQAYRDNVAEAHVGSAPDILDELALGFSRALLIEMKRVHKDRAEMVPLRNGSPSKWLPFAIE